MGMAIFWLAACAIGMGAFFWEGLYSLGVTWTRPEYSYGPIVPLITAYMTLRELHQRPVVPNHDSRWPGVVVVMIGMLFGLIGNLSPILTFNIYGFIIVIGGIVLILAGWREGLRFWPGWLHLFFMTPLPHFTYVKISLFLQLVSSELGVGFIYQMGIPVFLDGNIIDLGAYKLQVAEACSGLRYLFPLLSFGWLFAVLYNGPRWHKAILFVSTVPITVLMNSFRIAMIGILVNAYGIEQAEGFLHYFEGWVIFLFCVILLYLEAAILHRLVSRANRSRHVLDIDFEGVFRPLSKAGGIAADKVLVGTSVAVLVLGVGWQFAPSRVGEIDRVSFDRFPMQIGGWTGLSTRLSSDIEGALQADDYLVANFRSRSGSAPVNLLFSFYQSTIGSADIHSPEVCIPSGGWEVSSWQQHAVSVGDGGKTAFRVNRAIIQKGEQRRLVYFWYEMRGRRFTGEYESKVNTFFDAIRYGRSDGALVRLVTPIEGKAAEAAADKVLGGFIEQLLPRLPAYLPSI